MHLCLCVFKQWFSFGLPPSVLNIAMNKKNIKGESLQQRFKCGRWVQGCDHMFKKKTLLIVELLLLRWNFQTLSSRLSIYLHLWFRPSPPMLFAADSFVFILGGFAHCLFLQDDADVFLQFKGKKEKNKQTTSLLSNTASYNINQLKTCDHTQSVL